VGLGALHQSVEHAGRGCGLPQGDGCQA
jgi:hypothetical protein